MIFIETLKHLASLHLKWGLIDRTQRMKCLREENAWRSCTFRSCPTWCSAEQQVQPAQAVKQRVLHIAWLFTRSWLSLLSCLENTHSGSQWKRGHLLCGIRCSGKDVWCSCFKHTYGWVLLGPMRRQSSESRRILLSRDIWVWVSAVKQHQERKYANPCKMW